MAELEELRELLRETQELLLDDPSNTDLLETVEELKLSIQAVSEVAGEVDLKPSSKSVPMPTFSIKKPVEPKKDVFCEFEALDGSRRVGRVVSRTDAGVRVHLVGKSGIIQDVSDVSHLTELEPKHCAKGSKLQAVWEGDGKWYNCKVVKSTVQGDSFLVEFDGFSGDLFKVRPEWLRLRDHTQSTSHSRETKNITGEASSVLSSAETAKSGDQDISNSQLKKKRQLEYETESAQAKKLDWQKFNEKMNKR